MYYTTLNKIREHDPCVAGWQKLLTYLGKTKADDEPLALATILEANGIEDAIWALRAVDDIDDLARLFAVRCVREHCQHLLTDPRSLAALDVSEMYAIGEATGDDMDAARGLASDAAIGAASDAASDAAWGTTWEAACDAARGATEGAACDAARGATEGAPWDAARDAARGATWEAAWGVARDAAMGAACDAARGATEGAPWDAARGATWGTTWDAAYGAAYDAASVAISTDFRVIFCEMD